MAAAKGSPGLRQYCGATGATCWAPLPEGPHSCLHQLTPEKPPYLNCPLKAVERNSSWEVPPGTQNSRWRRGAGAQGGSLSDLESPGAGKERADGDKVMLTGGQVSRHRGIPSARGQS